ncbi:drug resistance transporter, EmrB/QacA subfamily [Ligilactobacillus sp. WC1T17]|uniref:Drug resistance transporter, EmrB/QacA subfamily n=1 Tax=Ligilactobacillus ruminis TaxID=1623 RepID=A0ABY1A9S2_9LACO|nr:drug resistance transporter, EmrB/QacA subfamily [Ligilactobacillus ruminis]
MKENKVYMALFTSALSTFIGVLNETSLNVAYPKLASYFKVSLDTVQWVTTGYLLTVTIMMGATAYLLKQFNARWLSLVSNIAFISGALICSFSVNFKMLLLGRIIQGIATGLATPVMFHIIFTQVPNKLKGLMAGVGGMVISFAPALGPTYGGIVVDQTNSWRFIFNYLIILGIIALILGQIFINTKAFGNDKPFSYGAFVTLGLSVASLVYASSVMAKGSMLTLMAFIILGLVLGALFVKLNNSGQSRLFDLGVFKHKTVALATLTYFCLQFINIGIAVVIPLYMQYVLKTSSTTAGSVLFPGALIGALLSPLAGTIADSVGASKPVITGGIFLLLSSLCFLLLQKQMTVILITVIYIFLRSGFNLAFSNTINNATSQVEIHNIADINSIFNVTQQFAGSLGVSILTGIMAMHQAHGQAGFVQNSYEGGQADFILVAILAGIALVAMITNYSLQKKA